MNPYDTWLKSIAIGLETMAKGIHSIAKTVYDMGSTQAPEEPAKAEPEPMKAETPPTAAPKKAKPTSTKSIPATDKVLKVIKGSKDGVDNQTIVKKTGLNQKQVSSALLRLKKYGKVKSVKRGVHTAV
jgi:predicted Rossmann fold nucleotide-binding protein DprA/Smf involved in DNA uptake